MSKMTVKYMNPLGDFDSKYGQKYYGRAHDVDLDVTFNMMHPVNFEDGDILEYEEKVIREKGPNSKNPGEEYIQLKKVKRSGSQESSLHTTPQPIKAPPPAAADKYLKDISDYPMRVFTSGLGYMDAQQLVKGGKYLDDYLAFVKRVAGDLLQMSESIRSGDLTAEKAPEEPEKITSVAQDKKAAKYEFKKEDEDEEETDFSAELDEPGF